MLIESRGIGDFGNGGHYGRVCIKWSRITQVLNRTSAFQKVRMS